MKRSTAQEMMDMPGNPPDLLADDLSNLRIINRYLGGYRGVLRALGRLIAEYDLDNFSLLDVGTGSGDIPVAIAMWARRKRLTARIIALDPEPLTVQTAVDQTREYPEIGVVRGDGMTLPFEPASFDFVLSSQMLHHFSEEAILAMLESWSQVARRAIIVSDLVRHPVAYHGIRLLTRVFTRNIMTQTDGPLSVQRAFSLNEWRNLFARAGVGSFRVFPSFPFRQTTLISVGR